MREITDTIRQGRELFKSGEFQSRDEATDFVVFVFKHWIELCDAVDQQRAEIERLTRRCEEIEEKAFRDGQLSVIEQ